MEMKKIDPWLLKAMDESACFPNKPYDLTKVKVITKWPDIGIWRNGMCVGDWLEVETGAFDILGELPNLHTLIFPWGFSHKDFAFLKNCKKLKKLDVGMSNFRDCSLLTQLPDLRYVCLPNKNQLIHMELLDGLKAKIEFTPYCAEEYKPVQAAQPAPKRKLYQGDVPLKALLEDIKARTKVPAYRLRVKWGIKPSLTDSKIGGLPYWDLSQP